MQFRFNLKRTARIPVLMLALAFVYAAHAADYKVMDSGVVLGDTSSIQWMDNDRVLFLGATNEYCRRDSTPSSYHKLLPRIAEYDTRNGNVAWHGGVGVVNLCYANGYVSYRRQIVVSGLCPTDSGNEAWDFLQGAWGRESVHEAAVYDRGSCKPVPKSVVEANDAWAKKTAAEALEKNKKKLRMVRLREEHGWLAIRDGGSHPDHPVAIYPPGREDRPVQIDTTLFKPWLANKNNIEFIRFEAFKGAYLLALNDRSFKGSDHRALWWLYPDGTVEPILLLRHDGGRQDFFSARMVPTRSGLLAVSGYPKQNKNGLYRNDGQSRFEMVDRGWIGESPVVSPDGCKLAYGIHTKGFGNWPEVYRLHVIDVCTNVKR